MDRVVAGAVVLRRRSVPTDPTGTYLLTCKGRTRGSEKDAVLVGSCDERK